VVSDLYLGDPTRALKAFEQYKQLTGEDKPVSGWIAELRQRLGLTPSKRPAGESAPGAGSTPAAPGDASPSKEAPGDKAPGNTSPGEKSPGEKAPAEKAPGGTSQPEPAVSPVNASSAPQGNRTGG
jgi:hypothetical protein